MVHENIFTTERFSLLGSSLGTSPHPNRLSCPSLVLTQSCVSSQCKSHACLFCTYYCALHIETGTYILDVLAHYAAILYLLSARENQTDPQTVRFISGSRDNSVSVLTREAVLSQGLQHSEKVGPVFREVLQVLAHHLQRALKQSVHDGRNIIHCLCLSHTHV